MSRPLGLLGALVAGTALTAAAGAGGGPENLFLVVNEDSWASQAVANEYVHLRAIPAGNVLYLNDLPSFERMGVEAFRTHILEQVFEAIRQRNLRGQIDYIVYSSDLPWGIGVAKDVGDRELPKIITRRAAITGLTYLYGLVLKKDIEYLGLAANWYYRRPTRPVRPKPWTPAEQTKRLNAQRFILAGKWAEALAVLRPLAENHPGSPDVQYNLACCLARLQHPDQAMAALERAVDAGWSDPDHTRQDPDLAPLRDRDGFKGVLEKMKHPAFDIQPTTAFRSTGAWSRQGNLTEPHAGRRYMLSTMLAVTSGRGNSLQEVRSYLRRSASADGTAPGGTVYLMKNRNVRSRVREWAFPTTVRKLEQRGVSAKILAGVLPENRPDVAGALVGTATFDWKRCGSTILPGAICEHLTSAGGVMSAGASQTPLSEFLRYGAAGTSGTVTEPMAVQAKFPSALIHVHYAAGASLAEAFYQSVFGPYQLLIVGDPLCRPWATLPQVTVDGARPGQTVQGTLRLRPGTANLEADQVDHYELLIYGVPHKRCTPGEAIELDTTTCPDGYLDVRLVAVAAGPLATRGFLRLPLKVNNRGMSLTVRGPAEKEVAWGEPVRVSASLKGAREIRFMHNTRVLATIEGERGQAEIDTRRLGLGPVHILPVAHLPPEGRVKPSDFAQASGPPALTGNRVHPGQPVVGAPIALEVVPPPAVPPVQAPPATQRRKGLRLTANQADPVCIDSLIHAKPLYQAGLNKGGAMTVEAYVEVPQEGLYQVQIRTNGRVEITVSGRALPVPVPGRWTFLPVRLAPGTHQLKVSGAFQGQPQFDLRFGRRGTRHLDAERFTCTGPFPEKKGGANRDEPAGEAAQPKH